MNESQSLNNDPFKTLFDGPDECYREHEDWEDWESDGAEKEQHSHGNDHPYDGPLLKLAAPDPSSSPLRRPKSHGASGRDLTSRLAINTVGQNVAAATTTPSPQASMRAPVQKSLRPKSRARQKAQNAKAGIRLVTDMTKFRKQQQQQQQQQQKSVTEGRRGKFVDAAALRALEGRPSDSSVGSWHWLRRRANSSNAGSPDTERAAGKGSRRTEGTIPDLSPNDRPIVIGISLPEDDLASRTETPQTATAESAIDLSRYMSNIIPPQQQPKPIQRQQLSPEAPIKSVWSPDTEDGSPLSSAVSRVASSVYSQPDHPIPQGDVPPVPAVPQTYLAQIYNHRVSSVESSDSGTPITLFEEDGNSLPSHWQSRLSRTTQAPSVVTSNPRQSGWWDHVRTPFSENSNSPFSAKTTSPLTPASARAITEQAAPPVPRVPVLPHIASQAVSVSQVSPLLQSPDGWWKNSPDEKQEASTSVVPVETNKPALGISTAAANTGHDIRSRGNTETSTEAVNGETPLHSRAASMVPTVVPTVVPSELSRWETGEHQQRDNQTPTPSDDPPPYESPSRSEGASRYRAVFPPGHALRAQFPPSPGPISPGLTYTMTSQGAIHMSNVPLTLQDGMALPSQPARAFVLPGFAPPFSTTTATKAERKRRRHEKEDAIARRAGSLWRGRGCMPDTGCFGRKPGREARKRRRICCGVVGGVVLVIVLAVVLAVTLTKKHNKNSEYSFWLNTTDFPPIPTGVTTVVGAENAVNANGCVQPTTLWSCSLPKEQQAANAPFAANVLTFVLDIQFDNSSARLWDTPDGRVPTPTIITAAAASSGSSKTTITTSATTTTTSTKVAFDAGFTPQPSLPAFQEMWFLGNTTDGIVSDRKAGEPTPFYVTFVSSVNSSTIGLNALDKRDSASGLPFPASETNENGTGAAAVLHPLPVQQQLRLFDRGLPTEHFGFYNYFSKTIYVQSIAKDASTDSSKDASGGSLESEAALLVTFLQTRFLVQIWTRSDNNTRMLNATGAGLTAGASMNMRSNTTQPGTFPYPITVTEDLHGGDFSSKGNFARPIDSRQHIVQDNRNATIIVANLEFGGTLVNHASNPSFGGSDGGTGGCKCTWTNFIGLNGNTN